MKEESAIRSKKQIQNLNVQYIVSDVGYMEPNVRWNHSHIPYLQVQSLSGLGFVTLSYSDLKGELVL